MSDNDSYDFHSAFSDAESLPLVVAVPEPRRKGWTWLAWIGIVLTVTGLVVQRNWPVSDAGNDMRGERISLTTMEMQCRYMVGAHCLLGQQAAGLYEQAGELNRGSVEQRLRFMVLAGELAGPAEALKQLARFDAACRENHVTLTETQQRVRAALGQLYEDYDRGDVKAASVVPAERRLLEADMGWFGKLALHPQDADDTAGREVVTWVALRTFGIIIGIFLFGLLATMVGFVALIGFIVWCLYGGVTFRLTPGSIYGGVYAETFALWLIAYGGMNLAAPWFPFTLPMLLQAGLLMTLSLVVLAWPMVRGVPWRQFRADIGWTCGNPFAEIGSGIACYVANLPVVAAGFMVTLVILLVQNATAHAEGGGEDFTSAPGPAHPIILFMTDGNWGTRLQIFFLACVIAPFVEETMFRGLLYRHGRELTGRFGRLASAVLSTLVVSFIFAVIHPQGLVAVPLLMSLAFGFSLAREWRGSLLPCMFAHGMSNGIVMTVAMIALGP